jgi:hypothetical protein
MRFIAILGGTCVIFGMILGTIYFWGLGQVFPKFDHPFFNHPKPWLVVPAAWIDDTNINSRLGPETVFWVDVYRGPGEVLVVGSEKSTTTLEKTLTDHPQRRWILNIKQNAMDIDRQLSQVVQPFVKTQEIVIQSEFDVVLRSTRELLANTPYGSSQSDILRFASFKGMAPWSTGLLPATPFKGDILVSPLKWRTVQLLGPEIVAEVHRRQKYVIAGPLSFLPELSQAQGLGGNGAVAVDGYYVTTMKLLILAQLQLSQSAQGQKAAPPVAQ